MPCFFHHQIRLFFYHQIFNVVIFFELFIFNLSFIVDSYDDRLAQYPMNVDKIIGNNLVNRTNIAIIQHLYEPNAIRRTQLQKRGRLEREQQKCFMQKMRRKKLV